MIKLSDIKSNPNNPRLIKDDKFKKLVNSIKEFPKMMDLRPIIIDNDSMILGGNMRLKALLELKYSEVPNEWIKKAKDLTEDETRRFIIADNVGFGEHDWDLLANEWDSEQLIEWGLDVWNNNKQINLNDFFEENNEPKEEKFKIILEYTEEDYAEITELFKNYSGTKEKIVFNLLKN